MAHKKFTVEMIGFVHGCTSGIALGILSVRLGFFALGAQPGFQRSGNNGRVHAVEIGDSTPAFSVVPEQISLQAIKDKSTRVKEAAETKNRRTMIDHSIFRRLVYVWASLTSIY